MRIFRWLQKAADTAMPYIDKCVVCGIEKDVQGALCSRCADDIALLKHGQTAAKQFAAFSVYNYEGVAAKIVRGFKYNDKRYLSQFMADQMAKSLGGGYSAICHVPLHKKRLRQRGFDQAELLAVGISKKTGIPFADVTRRIKNTKMQVKLAAKQRKENMRGAFVGTGRISGSVVLVDDVLTTGATTAECACALIGAGASSVFVLTFARSTGEASSKRKWFVRR